MRLSAHARHTPSYSRSGRVIQASVLTEGRVRTRDLGGQASTTEFTDAICREVER